jgi:hypothetical protein
MDSILLKQAQFVGLVTDDWQQRLCKACGTKQWMVAIRCLGVNGGFWRPEPHLADCGKPCAAGYYVEFGKPRLAVDEAHMDNLCLDCLALNSDSQ